MGCLAIILLIPMTILVIAVQAVFLAFLSGLLLPMFGIFYAFMWYFKVWFIIVTVITIVRS